MNRPRILHSQIRDVEFGTNVTVVKPVNLYECKIGDDCFIGPFVEIQKGVIIGNRCKIQSHAFICELVLVDDECIISHGAMFINDLYTSGGSAGGNKELWKPTNIGHYVLIGTNATILPVTVVDNLIVGAGSGVTKDILIPGIYAGNPATLLRKL